MYKIDARKSEDHFAKKLAFEGKVTIEQQESAKHAQMMHIGSYEAEEETLKVLHAFIDESGHKMAGYHREVYLKDPMRTGESKLNTIIRYQVEPK